jgi:ATP-dependent DNA ligase
MIFLDADMTVPSFTRLARNTLQAVQATRHRLDWYAFDILRLSGEALHRVEFAGFGSDSG